MLFLMILMLGDGPADVDDVAALLVCQVIFVGGCADLLLLKLLRFVGHGLFGVLLSIS